MTISRYYRLARKASKEIGSHPGLVELRRLCRASSSVLDVGCGEGSRLNTLLAPDQKGWGIDISSAAIAAAKKQYLRHHFRVADAAKLPFTDNKFGLVYSAFTLEHTTDPAAVLSEMIRVCRPGGQIVTLCPNFGAPNRRSPRSVENPYYKFFSGLIRDFFPAPGLTWTKVTPAEVFKNPDDDTTVEPYLHSLMRFLKSQSLVIDEASSLWEIEPWSINPRKFLFKLLGRPGVFPFKYWGPQIFLIARK